MPTTSAPIWAVLIASTVLTGCRNDSDHDAWVKVCHAHEHVDPASPTAATDTAKWVHDNVHNDSVLNLVSRVDRPIEQIRHAVAAAGVTDCPLLDGTRVRGDWP